MKLCIFLYYGINWHKYK